MAESGSEILEDLREAAARSRRRTVASNVRFARASASGVSSSRTYIVGTPKKSVGRKDKKFGVARL